MVLDFFLTYSKSTGNIRHTFSLMRGSNSIAGLIAVLSFADEHGITTTLVVSMRGLAPEFLIVQRVLSITA